MNEERLRETLIEILEEEKKQKKSKIPKNVDSSYKIFLNLNGKELAIVTLPTIISLIMSLLTLYVVNGLNIYTFVIAMLFNLIVFLTIYGFITITPVKERKNIRYIDYFKQKKKFKNRQKIYFYEGRDS
ncbi:hypothetical protein [Macrococcus armenti]|uniref:hypothetical protein n=1 Tax=Macrococcus armenti TaxID=2875764 RepID=UPI001CCEF231|nr:hypothetical protein [Macrococcus armenti]UBH09782.1 hypothetical protein LAU41_11825 [Macrococcus armenti]